jgi:DNA repair exonuclease SbcCD ATPase subunit
MFNFMKKKESEEESRKAEEIDEEEEAEEKKEEKKQEASQSMDITRIASEIDRLKAGVESFQEVRKAYSESFDRFSEQIGELRAMILDRDRIVQEIELKAVKASDLVESVQPEKLMVSLQKQEAKTEALKANMEGNESIMERVMDELKDMRKKIEFFRGVEEIVNLSEEVKKELVEIKKSEAAININTDKVDTIYAEIRKKFQDIDLFKDNLRGMQVSVEQNTKDIEFIKSKISGLAEKSEVEALVSKVQRYIDALKELEKKSSLSKDIEKLRALMDNIKS